MLYDSPGRFFAGLEMKMAMAYLVLNYDVQLETPGIIPQAAWYLTARVPNATAPVLLKPRKRDEKA